MAGRMRWWSRPSASAWWCRHRQSRGAGGAQGALWLVQSWRSVQAPGRHFRCRDAAPSRRTCAPPRRASRKMPRSAPPMRKPATRNASAAAKRPRRKSARIASARPHCAPAPKRKSARSARPRPRPSPSCRAAQGRVLGTQRRQPAKPAEPAAVEPPRPFRATDRRRPARPRPGATPAATPAEDRPRRQARPVPRKTDRERDDRATDRDRARARATTPAAPAS
jgi:translation initiation factor IF-2